MKETDWSTEAVKTGYARQVVQAFIKVGRAKEGFAFLSELRSSLTSDKVSIAQTYWRVGAAEEGRQLMREAAGSALAEAEADSRKQLPAWIAGVQIAMGDRDGGIVTLRGLWRFSADRLSKIRALLAGQFAFAGLDAEAFSLLDGTSADRAILPNIIVGQARRTDFEAAFRTLDQFRKLPPSPLEVNPSIASPMAAINSILRNAARTGDTDAFGQAVAAYREFYPRRAWRGAALLRDLARVGKATVALEYALAAQDLDEKVLSLCMVAEGLAGLPDPRYDPLASYDRW